MADDNPFADPADINPFADPSVQQASQSQPQEEDYNPFEGDAHTQGGAGGIAPPPTKEDVKSWNLLGKKKDKKEKPRGPERPPETEPPPPATLQPAAVIQPQEPPAYTPFQTPDPEVLRQQEDLARREQELAAREAQIARAADPRPNNFPPLPKWFPLKPCFYHNIKEEIPNGEQWIMWAILVMWAAYVVILIANSVILLLSLFVWTQPGFVDTYGTSFGVSLVYLVFGPPLSLICWYMPLYRAYRKDSSLFFMWFMFIFLIQGLGFILNAAGFIRLGACGWWLGSQAIQSAGTASSSPGFTQALGAMMVIMGFVWVALAIMDGLLLFRVHRYYRSSGGTLEKAQQEALRTAATSKTVRSAARQAVVTGMQAATSE